jgi:Major tropism determinant N-terminal domain
MSLRIRRGTNAQRTGITFDLGEIVYTTDTQKLYIGDGVTAGGKNLLETSAGNGFTFNQATQQIDFSIGNLNLNTSQVTEDASRLYYTDERAQDAVGAALVAGNSYNTGVTFAYDDANNRITAVSTGGLTNISADTNPSLGGNLSTGAFNISGNGSISAGTISATTGLGANLPLNGKTINGTGNINITGTIDAGRITTTGTTTIRGISATINNVGLEGNLELQNARSGIAVLQNTDVVGAVSLAAYSGSGYTKGTVLVGQMASNVVANKFAVDTGIYTLNADGNFRAFWFRNTGLFEVLGVSLSQVTTSDITAFASLAPEGTLAYDTTKNRAVLFNGASAESLTTIITAPSTATSTGTPGQIAVDASYVYVCTAINTWKRAAIASW